MPDVAPAAGHLLMQQNVMTSLVVPAAMILIAILCKWVTEPAISIKMFALGIDSTLAAVTSGLVHVCDMCYAYNAAAVPSATKEEILAAKDAIFAEIQASLVYCGGLAFLLLVVMGIHRRWFEPPKGKRATLGAHRMRKAMLLGVANLLGIGSLIAILLVLRKPCWGMG